jgi:uncharacterized protein YndB with AHSA1/START domain
MNRATMSTVNGEPVLRFERRFRHPVAKVWRAVSEPAELVSWFPAAVETELRPGAPMRFTFAEEAVVDGVWDGEVLEVDPPKVFMFRWNVDVLRFELIPDGDGCLLVFTQAVGGGAVGRLGAGRTAAGWDNCLDALAASLDGDAVPEQAEWLTPIESYVEEFGLGEGTVESTSDGWLVRFTRDLVWKPASEVWALLTEDTDVAVGDEPPLVTTHGYVPVGRVTAVDAPTLIEYEWCDDDKPVGTVRFTIVEDATFGTRVELTQTGPARLADVRPTVLAAWQIHLESFFAATHGVIRCPWPEDRQAELTKRYAERLG